MINKPKIVNPAANMLHEAYGITKERSDELCIKMDAMSNAMETTVMTTFHHEIDKLANICETNEELIFCVVTHTRWLLKQRYVTVI